MFADTHGRALRPLALWLALIRDWIHDAKESGPRVSPARRAMAQCAMWAQIFATTRAPDANRHVRAINLETCMLRHSHNLTLVWLHPCIKLNMASP